MAHQAGLRGNDVQAALPPSFSWIHLFDSFHMRAASAERRARLSNMDDVEAVATQIFSRRSVIGLLLVCLCADRGSVVSQAGKSIRLACLGATLADACEVWRRAHASLPPAPSDGRYDGREPVSRLPASTHVIRREMRNHLAA